MLGDQAMKVMVIGPESTGGRYVSRLIGKSDEIDEVRHWSMPHGPKSGFRFWPTEHNFWGWHPDACCVTVRDWYPTARSATQHHTLDEEVSERNLRMAYAKILGYMTYKEIPWRFVSYEALPNLDSVASIFTWLGVSVPNDLEVFVDGNGKWYE